MKVAITFSFILMAIVNFAQESEPMLFWSGKLKNSAGEKLSNVLIEITQEGKTVSKSNSGSGKYKTDEFKAGYVYKITFSKNGYYPKTLIADAKKGYFPEDMDQNTELEADISLDPKIVNCEIPYPEVVGRASINPATGYLDWDMSFGSNSGGVITKLYNQANAQIAALNMVQGLYQKSDFEKADSILTAGDFSYIDSEVTSKLASDIAAGIQNGVDAQYKRLVDKADEYLADGDLDKSEELFMRAERIKPTDTYPPARLQFIDERRKILAVIPDPKIDRIDTSEVETLVTEVDRPVNEPNEIVRTNQVNSSTVSNVITNRPAYVGDDMLAQKERYEDYQRELGSRTRSYRALSYQNNYRVREYAPRDQVKPGVARELVENTFLADLNARCRESRENRTSGD